MAKIFLNSFMCPHCDTKCSFYGGGKKDKVVLWCNGCHGGVYFQLRNYDIPEEDIDALIRVDTKDVIDSYPHRATTVNPAIPEEIADDYDEANKCIDVKASKATVTQCRRALQSTCVLKGANPKADLIDQIDELESKRVITPQLKDIAHTVRIIANWGAHPQQDPLKEIKFDDALEILKFTSEFLEDVFVRPARLETLKAKKGLK